MEQLQALIDALTSNRDQTPAQPVGDTAAFFADLEDDTLAEMEGTAFDAVDALKASKLTEESVAQLEVLADTIGAIRAEIERRDGAAAALASRAQELAARIGNSSVAFGDEDEEEAEDGDAATTSAAIEPTSIEPAPVSAAVARTRPRVDLSTIRRAPAAAGPGRSGGSPSTTVIASADLPNYKPNTRITSVKELAAAVSARFASFPIGSSNVEMRGNIATIHRNFPSDLVAAGNKDDDEMLAWATDERRLEGGSLAAAMFAKAQRLEKSQSLDSLTAALSPNAALPGAINTVWCAPYEIDTTLCDPLETPDGFIDLPTVGVRPPGVIYTQNLDWWRLFDFNADLTESLDPCFTKPCIDVPCPEWTQEDVTIQPFCIESCILKERANQPWYDWFVRRALTAFRRWQNVQVLEKILAKIAAQPGTSLVDFSVAPPPVPTPWGTAHSTLDSLSLLATWYRDLYRMPMNATFEVIAPHWVKNVIRDDMAKRFGCGCEDVTDARMMAWFANRGLRVQFVYDWQTLVATADLSAATGTVPGTNPPANKQIAVWPNPQTLPNVIYPMPIKAYPTTFDVLLFPAGTFGHGQVEAFRMDGLYDSANLKQNRYTKIFFEDAQIVMQRCYRAFRVKLPVCLNGGNFFTSANPVNPPCGSEVPQA